MVQFFLVLELEENNYETSHNLFQKGSSVRFKEKNLTMSEILKKG